ncbi:hypothetical protein JOM56_014314 [Amanita muscaria]
MVAARNGCRIWSNFVSKISTQKGVHVGEHRVDVAKPKSLACLGFDGAYRSLGEFSYRKLKPGVDDAVLASPADGTILHLGTITDSRVEQIKGIMPSAIKAIVGCDPDMEVVDDNGFANANGMQI